MFHSSILTCELIGVLLFNFFEKLDGSLHHHLLRSLDRVPQVDHDVTQGPPGKEKVQVCDGVRRENNNLFGDVAEEFFIFCYVHA